MTTELSLNIGPPEALTYPISDVPGGIDLTTVTAVSFQVRKPDSTYQTWSAQIPATVPKTRGLYASLAGTSNPTTGLLFAQYPFTGTEVTQNGVYLVKPILTVPGGTVPCESKEFVVPIF